MRHEAACGGADGEVETEVFNGSCVVQRIGQSENKDDSKGNGCEFQEILPPFTFIFSKFTVREYSD